MLEKFSFKNLKKGNDGILVWEQNESWIKKQEKEITRRLAPSGLGQLILAKNSNKCILNMI